MMSSWDHLALELLPFPPCNINAFSLSDVLGEIKIEIWFWNGLLHSRYFQFQELNRRNIFIHWLEIPYTLYSVHHQDYAFHSFYKCSYRGRKDCFEIILPPWVEREKRISQDKQVTWMFNAKARGSENPQSLFFTSSKNSLRALYCGWGQIKHADGSCTFFHWKNHAMGQSFP